jgi:hypothetical protein
MTSHTTIGFEKTNPPRIAYHTFTINAQGLLEHLIDGDLRAVVPPESFEAYAESWPDARHVFPAADTEPA